MILRLSLGRREISGRLGEGERLIVVVAGRQILQQNAMAVKTQSRAGRRASLLRRSQDILLTRLDLRHRVSIGGFAKSAGNQSEDVGMDNLLS